MASSVTASSVLKLGAIILCAVLAASSVRRTAPRDCDSLCETACSYLESAACNGLCGVPAVGVVSSEKPTCQSCKEATKKSCNTECVSRCNTTPDSPSSCSASGSM